MSFNVNSVSRRCGAEVRKLGSNPSSPASSSCLFAIATLIIAGTKADHPKSAPFLALSFGKELGRKRQQEGIHVATLEKRGDGFRLIFYYQGQRFQHSLKTSKA